MCDIHSIAQQASPNESGKFALPSAQRPAFSSVVVRTHCSTWRSRLGALEVAAQHVARAQLARAELAVRAGAELLRGHLHSSAPRRQT